MVVSMVTIVSPSAPLALASAGSLATAPATPAGQTAAAPAFSSPWTNPITDTIATVCGKVSPTTTFTTARRAAGRSSRPRFTVRGKVAHTTNFTVARLKKMRTVSATYFSIGGHPTTKERTAFVGVRLIDILKAACLERGAKSVTVVAADHYSATFTLQQVKANYIDQTRPGVHLPMIIAYSEGGRPYTGRHPFRLVKGQAVAGEYNRMYWVKIVTSVAGKWHAAWCRARFAHFRLASWSS